MILAQLREEEGAAGRQTRRASGKLAENENMYDCGQRTIGESWIPVTDDVLRQGHLSDR